MQTMDRLIAAIRSLEYGVAQDDLSREDLKPDVARVSAWAKVLEGELKEVERDAGNNTESR